MILITWFTESTNTLPEGGDATEFDTGSLQLDILENENYTSISKITAHAVEDGVAITDHLVLQNDKVTFKAVISNRQSSTRFVDGATHGTTELDNGVEAAGIIVPDDADRPGDVLEELLRLKDSGTRLSIDGLQRPIDDWMIESVSAPRSVTSAGTLVVDVSVMEIRTASLEEVDAPSPRVERGRRSANSGQSKGEDSSGSKEDTERQRLRSNLVSISRRV